MDIVVGLAAVLMGIVIIAFIASPTTGRGLDLFAAGFLPYRSKLDWPRGVQEEEPVRWTWPVGSRSDVPEFHEIGADDAPPTAIVDRGFMGEGMARRRR
jgi:hypothetical protein